MNDPRCQGCEQVLVFSGHGIGWRIGKKICKDVKKGTVFLRSGLSEVAPEKVGGEARRGLEERNEM